VGGAGGGAVGGGWGPLFFPPGRVPPATTKKARKSGQPHWDDVDPLSLFPSAFQPPPRTPVRGPAPPPKEAPLPPETNGSRSCSQQRCLGESQPSSPLSTPPRPCTNSPKQTKPCGPPDKPVLPVTRNRRRPERSRRPPLRRTKIIRKILTTNPEAARQTPPPRILTSPGRGQPKKETPVTPNPQPQKASAPPCPFGRPDLRRGPGGRSHYGVPVSFPPRSGVHGKEGVVPPVRVGAPEGRGPEERKRGCPPLFCFLFFLPVFFRCFSVFRVFS